MYVEKVKTCTKILYILAQWKLMTISSNEAQQKQHWVSESNESMDPSKTYAFHSTFLHNKDERQRGFLRLVIRFE
jgi:hypothetical protein